MVRQARERYRVKVSATIDPDLIRAVDLFVQQTPDYTRSKVFEDALRLWYACEQEKAMEAQFLGPHSNQEDEERADWRRVQRTAGARLFGRE